MPNAFIINKELDQITLNDVKSGFPMEGEFFFRFKYRYNSASVWLDLSNHKCPVPKFDGKIIVKVTRQAPKNTVLEELEAMKVSAGRGGRSGIEEFGQFSSDSVGFGASNPAPAQPTNLLDL